jgi:hypothetical protein
MSGTAMALTVPCVDVYLVIISFYLTLCLGSACLVSLAAGQLRAGAHSDYGSITILLGEDRPGGLEICTVATNNEWQRVPAVDGAFIVNVGDLMARWTNDRWLSTLHRVGLPNLDPHHDHHQFEKTVDGEKVGDQQMQSIVLFCRPNYFRMFPDFFNCSLK